MTVDTAIMSELQYLNYKIKLGLAYGLNNVMRLGLKTS